jgi:hypothetical protein
MLIRLLTTIIQLALAIPAVLMLRLIIQDIKEGGLD